MRRSADFFPANFLRRRAFVSAGIVAAGVALVVALALRMSGGGGGDKAVAVAKPALAVAVTSPRPEILPGRLSANGTIMAWQEASIGTEANGLRLATVNVDVGDTVRRGQILAVFDSGTVAAELAQSRAAVAEAEAAHAEAEDNARRGRRLETSGAMSQQQFHRYLTAELTARARLSATQAALQLQEVRLAQTQVSAPDDGVISASSATVGAVPAAGQELFRLIRRGRLEWRAEVAAFDLAKLRPGQVAHVTPVGGETIEGILRKVAPTVDTQTRNGLVYVGLPFTASARAGMFARGEFDLGTYRTMTLPQSAVLLRDGFSYVMRIGSDSKVEQTQVTTGRRVGDRIEIAGGLGASARVVASGGAFLGDGDLVRVVDDPKASEGGEPVSDGAIPVPRGGASR